MKNAGIKVWVLTGDKIETAVNIGYSSGLLDNYMIQSLISGTTTIDIERELVKAEKNLPASKEFSVKSALIVSGEALLKIQEK